MTKMQKKQHWPNHRSIFYNDELSLLFLINFNEHLTIYSIYNKEKAKNPIDFPKMFNSISEYEKIISHSEAILSKTRQETRLKAQNPYGDGTSSKKIEEIISKY